MPPSIPSIGIAIVVKNEAPYLVEWLAHHRLLGIKHFFIADNDSTDGTTELLAALQDAGLVVHHRFPAPPGQKPHVPALEMLLERHRSDVDWLAIIDADEFIWPTGNYSTLPDFLAAFLQSHPQTGAIALNWALHGSSGQWGFESLPVTQRFHRHAMPNHPVNRHIKTLARTDCIRKIPTSHNVVLPSHNTYLHTNGVERAYSDDLHPVPELAQCMSHTICWEHFRINHYVIKSYQEFIQKKQQRGRALTTYPLDNAFFLAHDLNDMLTKPDPAYTQSLAGEIKRILEATTGFDHNQPVRSLLERRQEFTQTYCVPQVGCLDSIKIEDGKLRLFGWVLPWAHDNQYVTTIEIRVANGPWHAAIDFTPFPRPDVQQHYSQAPENCGFIAYFVLPSKLTKNSHLEARAITSDDQRTAPISHGMHALNQLPSFHD